MTLANCTHAIRPGIYHVLTGASVFDLHSDTAVKAELSLCARLSIWTESPSYVNVWNGGIVALCIGTSALHAPTALPPRGRDTGMHWTIGWMCPNRIRRRGKEKVSARNGTQVL
jgi:hypothetical protein